MEHVQYVNRFVLAAAAQNSSLSIQSVHDADDHNKKWQ